MTAIVVTICGLFVVLGFEIRHRQILEILVEVKNQSNELEEAIGKLAAEMKLKKNIFEESNPPK
jgi:hypothetical protein